MQNKFAIKLKVQLIKVQHQQFYLNFQLKFKIKIIKTFFSSSIDLTNLKTPLENIYMNSIIKSETMH
jgi:hypothetical protein